MSSTTKDTRAPSSLLRANVVVATGTALSRLTGFARFALFGVIFGRATLWDAYNAANNSPNMVYELLLGGILSATIVPVFTRLFADEDEDAISVVISTCIVAVAVLTAVAVVAAPLIFRLSAIKVSKVDAGEYHSLGTSLARIFLIQIFFYGVSALWGALLKAKRRFFASAWSPILSNVAIIVSLLVAKGQLKSGEDGFAKAFHNTGFRNTLAFGATIGISLQAIALYPALKNAGISLSFRPDWKHPAVRKVFSLSGWTLGYVACNILTAQVVQNLAKPGSGNASAYTLAFTFFLLPHALLATSVATTFEPDLAGFVKRRDRAGFVERMSFGIRITALVTVPAGFGLFVLRRPIIGALLEHGHFKAGDSLETSRALAGFALGLVGFSVYVLALSGFYSHQDTKTAFTINVFENAINVVLAVVLVHRYGVLGLGAAFAIAYLVSAVLALVVLQNKVGGFDVRQLVTSIGKMILAAVVMAETIWFLDKAVGSNHGTGAAVRLALAVPIGTAMYVSVMLALGSPELSQGAALARRGRKDRG